MCYENLYVFVTDHLMEFGCFIVTMDSGIVASFENNM